MTTAYGVQSPYVPSNCTKTADELSFSVHDEPDYANFAQIGYHLPRLSRYI